jgi:hypothetical protein
MPVPVKLPITEIYIKLFWTEGFGTGAKEFYTLQQFADFLNENPDIKRAIKDPNSSVTSPKKSTQ